VTDRSRILVGVVAGAAVGALAGYLLLTERGRRLRREFEPDLDEILRELGRLGGTVDRARSVVSDAWRALGESKG
jgi:gas vesicle protein